MLNVDALKDNLKTQLDPQQYQIATTRTATGHRRVRGAAGSGKSLALAARAAMLACENKRVLVCTYNITLYNYLSSLVEEFIPQEISRRITFTNFHYWCRNVCKSTGYLPNYEKLKEKYTKTGYNGKEYINPEFWKDPVAGLVSEIYGDPMSTPPTYDAILVDEGQDYRISWWQTLQKAVVQGGEMLLVADKTQNIHGTAQAWTEERMKDCGFSGDWMRLRNSYRLPAGIIPILEDFLEQFPYEGEPDLPPPKVTDQTDMFDDFRWVQVSDASVEDVCLKEIERLYNDPDIPTVYFLSGTDIGMQVVSALKQRGLDILDTHAKGWHKSRSKKVGLHPGCAQVCATTVHSFKGWETPHLVVYVESIQSDTDRALFYTALSRLNGHPKGSALTVISSCPKLEPFGREHFSDFDSPILDTFDFNTAVDAIPF
jgi:hypothetical protein